MTDWIERYGPLFFGVASCALAYFFRADLVDLARRDEIDFSNLYSSVFDWSAIQTGFLFAIFGFVAGKTDGFIQQIKDTKEMRLFLAYTKRALLLGFAITFVSVPLTVTAFDVSKGPEWKFHLLAGWIFLTVWGFFSFLRVAYIFGDLLKVKDHKRVVG